MSTGRSVTMTTNGVVAAPHYLASMAGARILMAGGNAVDAAIATNAVLNVVYPHMCSPGGDAFMLIYDSGTKELRALNASGRAPAAATREAVLSRGLSTMPLRGPLAVTVPGALDGWATASEAYGSMPLAQVLAPAIEYAERGIPVSDKLARSIRDNQALLAGYPTSAAVFLPDGQPPRGGQLLRNPGLARSLEAIAKEGRDAFYCGSIARKIASFIREQGGLLTEEDLESHRSDWTDPISTDYRGYTVYEFPPNTQGLVALMELNIVEGYDLRSSGHNTAETVHLQVEAKKLAFADRGAYISDPQFVRIPMAPLLSKSYAAQRRRLIDPTQASYDVAPGSVDGDTIYLCAVDRDGNAVSLIQSIYYSFGSGMVAGDTGMLLQNRGSYFSLQPDHVNRLEPGKRTLHTLIPGMVFKDGQPVLVFGTMGGDGQAQTHLQFLNNWVDFGMNVQEAIEAPRWLSGRSAPEDPEMTLYLEGRFPEAVRKRLESRGHIIKVVDDWAHIMGHAQAIYIDRAAGVLHGAADPRGDGAAIGW